MITCPCIVYPFTPHFYTVKLGFIVYIFFLIFALKHRLWVLVRIASVSVPTIYVLSNRKENGRVIVMFKESCNAERTCI